MDSSTVGQHVIPHKRFYFMRHGQTDWNLEGKWQGRRNDIPLNQHGEKQARDAAEVLKHLRFDYIIHSPLLRAAKTAHLVNVHGVPQKAISCLEEHDCGLEREGVVAPQRHEVSTMDIDTMHAWITKLATFRDDHESLEDFAFRVRRGLSNALSHDGLVLVVAHGIVWRMVCELLGIKPFRLPNCAVVEVIPPDEVCASWTYRLYE